MNSCIETYHCQIGHNLITSSKTPLTPLWSLNNI